MAIDGKLRKIVRHTSSIGSFRGLEPNDTLKILLSLTIGYLMVFLSYILRPSRKYVKRKIGGCHVEFIDRIAHLKYVLRRTPDGLYFMIRPNSGDYWISSPEIEEPEVFSVLKPKKGEVVIDVGAHIGTYAVRAARAVGEEGLVAALEPEPENFKLLNANVKLNNLGNVVVLPKGAYDASGTFTLYVSRETGWHSLVEIPEKFVREIRVPIVTLDGLLDEFKIHRVDWVKIDIEGAELAVLRGGTKILDIAKNLIIEVWDRNANMIQTLRSKGYEVMFLARYSERNFYIWAKRQ